jgi:hypothetical protein
MIKLDDKMMNSMEKEQVIKLFKAIPSSNTDEYIIHASDITLLSKPNNHGIDIFLKNISNNRIFVLPFQYLNDSSRDVLGECVFEQISPLHPNSKLQNGYFIKILTPHQETKIANYDPTNDGSCQFITLMLLTKIKLLQTMQSGSLFKVVMQ